MTATTMAGDAAAAVLMTVRAGNVFTEKDYLGFEELLDSDEVEGLQVCPGVVGHG